MSLLELFCPVDDFWLAFAPRWKHTLLQSGQIKRQRNGQLVESAIMTILIHFHQSHDRDFKAYYTQHVLPHLRADFPGLVSSSRFVQLIPSVLCPLAAYLETCRGQCNGLSFVDSTKLVVCHNRRIKHHRVFADWPSVARIRSIGSTASNCLWSSTTKGISSLAASPPAMWMIAALCLSWPSGSLAN